MHAPGIYADNQDAPRLRPQLGRHPGVQHGFGELEVNERIGAQWLDDLHVA